MILIADSGSTKCDWLLVDHNGEQIEELKSMGLNPYFHSSEFVEQTLKSEESIMEYADKVDHVFFYGAGASTPHLCEVIEEGLKPVFPNAKILVDHDLLGAAYAAYNGEPCVAAILGTGSNSCFFDGKEIREEVPALAYILGDEGSGSYFGKQLLREYFYKQLPDDIRVSFEETFELSKDDIVKHVYSEPHANVWLAAFMQFIGKHREHPHVQNWVKEGIREFLRIHVTCYPEHKEVKTNFIGSIGYYFPGCLKEACELEGVNLGITVKKPIYRLAKYHFDYIIPEMQTNE